MNKRVRSVVGLTLVCVALGVGGVWATSGYPERVERARQSPPPQGMAYLDTCDGRPTERLGSAAVDEGCLADYPGEFARALTLGGSAVLLVAGLGTHAWCRRQG